VTLEIAFIGIVLFAVAEQVVALTHFPPPDAPGRLGRALRETQ
jgi:hypothetical protein